MSAEDQEQQINKIAGKASFANPLILTNRPRLRRSITDIKETSSFKPSTLKHRSNVINQCEKRNTTSDDERFPSKTHIHEEIQASNGQTVISGRRRISVAPETGTNHSTGNIGCVDDGIPADIRAPEGRDGDEDDQKSKVDYPIEWEEAYKLLKEETDDIIHDLKKENRDLKRKVDKYADEVQDLREIRDTTTQLLSLPSKTSHGKLMSSITAALLSKKHSISTQSFDPQPQDEEDSENEDIEEVSMYENGENQGTQKRLQFDDGTPNARAFGDFGERKKKNVQSATPNRDAREFTEVKKALKESLTDRRFSISMTPTQMRSWVSTFVQTCRSFNCNDDDLLRLFKLMIDNNSMTTTVGFMSEEATKKWSTLYPYLRRMSKIPEAQEALATLVRCKQNTLSVAEYYAAFLTALLDCGESTLSNELQVHYFVQGLSDQSLRRRCLSWDQMQRREGKAYTLETLHLWAMDQEDLDIKSRGFKKAASTLVHLVNNVDVIDGFDVAESARIEEENQVPRVQSIQPPSSSSSSLSSSSTSSSSSSSSSYRRAPQHEYSSSSSSWSHRHAPQQEHPSRRYVSHQESRVSEYKPWGCTGDWVRKNLWYDKRKVPTRCLNKYQSDGPVSLDYMEKFLWNGAIKPSKKREGSSLPFLTSVNDATICRMCGAQADHITQECRYNPCSPFFLYFGSEYRRPTRSDEEYLPLDGAAPPPVDWGSDKRRRTAYRP